MEGRPSMDLLIRCAFCGKLLPCFERLYADFNRKYGEDAADNAARVLALGALNNEQRDGSISAEYETSCPC